MLRRKKDFVSHSARLNLNQIKDKTNSDKGEGKGELWGRAFYSSQSLNMV